MSFLLIDGACGAGRICAKGNVIECSHRQSTCNASCNNINRNETNEISHARSTIVPNILVVTFSFNNNSRMKKSHHKRNDDAIKRDFLRMFSACCSGRASIEEDAFNFHMDFDMKLLKTRPKHTMRSHQFFKSALIRNHHMHTIWLCISILLGQILFYFTMFSTTFPFFSHFLQSHHIDNVPPSTCHSHIKSQLAQVVRQSILLKFTLDEKPRE